MLTFCSRSLTVTFTNGMHAVFFDDYEPDTADKFTEHIYKFSVVQTESTQNVKFGNRNTFILTTAIELAELLSICCVRADFDACQAAVNFWLFKKQPKPSANEERFLACQTFRDTQSFIFVPGMKCWLDYTDPVEDWINKDWVLSRGSEWVVVEVINYSEGDCCITVCQHNKPSVFFYCTPTQLVPDI